MEVVHARCLGMDVSKSDAKVCVRIQGRGSSTLSSTPGAARQHPRGRPGAGRLHVAGRQRLPRQLREGVLDESTRGIDPQEGRGAPCAN